MKKYLLDENQLGLAQLLEGVEFSMVGGVGCPPKKTEDLKIVNFAKSNGFVIVTRDVGMLKLCELKQVPFITFSEVDFAKKIIRDSKRSKDSL